LVDLLGQAGDLIFLPGEEVNGTVDARLSTYFSHLASSLGSSALNRGWGADLARK
jgi:hypothetical protein